MQAGGRSDDDCRRRCALQAPRVPAASDCAAARRRCETRPRHHGAAVLSAARRWRRAASRRSPRQRVCLAPAWSCRQEGRPALAPRSPLRPAMFAASAGLGRRFGAVVARSVALARPGGAARRPFCRGTGDGGGGRPCFGAAPAGIVSARRLCRGTRHGDGRPRHLTGRSASPFPTGSISRLGSTRRRSRLRSCCCRRVRRVIARGPPIGSALLLALLGAATIFVARRNRGKDGARRRAADCAPMLVAACRGRSGRGGDCRSWSSSPRL